MSEKKKTISRRDTLRWLALAGGGAVLAACGGQGAGQAPDVAQPSPTEPAQEQPLPAGTKIPEPSSAPSGGEPGAPANSSAGQSAQAAPPAGEAPGGQAYLAVARGADPAAITEAAIKALGGIERFVKAGSDVIVKPKYLHRLLYV